MVGQELHVSTIDLDTTLLALSDILLTVERCEAPLLGDDDLLATWELVLRSAKSLNGGGTVCRTSAVF